MLDHIIKEFLPRVKYVRREPDMKKGKIYTDGDNDNKTELYFQIYKGRTLLNPDGWIAR